MLFDYSLQTKLPINLVYQTLRDNLYRLAPYLPDVKKITLLDRKETNNDIVTVNKWEANNILPASLSEFIKLDNIAWTDRGSWSKSRYVCTWSYEPFIFQEHINARGQDIYTTDGTNTTIRLTGEMFMNFDLYPFVIVVPSIMREKIVNQFMKLTLSLLQSNFTALIKGLEQYVRENNLL